MWLPGLAELNAVDVLARHRNFRRAAAELGMSASALSHTVAALEQKLGIRLFNRTTRSVALSEAGEGFLANVRPALRDIVDALETANAYRDTPTGTLRLNMAAGAAEMLFEPLIVEFARRYPAMTVDIVPDDGLTDIVAEGFDAGIRNADTVPKDMIAIRLTPDLRFVVVGSPDYLANHPAPTTPAELMGHACIRRRFRSGRIYRWEFIRHGQALEIDVSGPLILGQDDLIVAAALQGLGLAYVGAWRVEEHLAAGRLVEVLPDWPPTSAGLALYYPSRRQLPAGLRALVDLIRELRPTQA